MKKIFSIFIAICMMFTATPKVYGAVAGSSIDNVVLNNGVISWNYTTDDPTITRFDFYFRAGDSSTVYPATNKVLAWGKANTGTYASATSKGVTIGKNGNTFSVTVNLNNWEPYNGSLDASLLKAPNTHLWLYVVPCYDLAAECPDSYKSSHYLGDFESWDIATATNIKIGNTFYNTLNAAASNAASGQTIEVIDDLKATESVILKDDVTLRYKINIAYKAISGNALIELDTLGNLSIKGTGNGKVFVNNSNAVINVKTFGNKYVNVQCDSPYEIVVPDGNAYGTTITIPTGSTLIANGKTYKNTTNSAQQIVLDVDAYKDAQEIADLFKDAGDTSTLTGSGVNEVATNKNVNVTVDENGNYKVTLNKDIDRTITLPDNLSKIVIDLNGHNITGTSATSGEDGSDGIKIVAGNETGTTTDITITGKGRIMGGKGSAGKNGGNAISTSEDATTTSVFIDKSVALIGGNGGDTMDDNNTAGNGGNGVVGNIKVSIDGTIRGGNGGNSKDGNGGNGGVGITTKTNVTVLENGNVNGGDGGDSINQAAGNGGTGIIGNIDVNKGTIAGGDGGSSEMGNAGNGATGVDGNIASGSGYVNGGIGGNSIKGNIGAGGIGITGTTTGNVTNGSNGKDLTYNEEFETYRKEMLAKLANMHTSGESKAIKDMIDKAIETITSYEYNPKKSLEENKEAINVLMTNLDKSVAEQIALEKASVKTSDTTSMSTLLVALSGSLFVYIATSRKKRKMKA